MSGFIKELRRRRVFRTAAVYIVSAWLVMQVADVLFPGWGLPDAAVNVLFFAAIVGFPLAIVFGWFFDVTTHGIVRTPSVDEEGSDKPISLQRSDYLVLGALVLIAGLIVYDATTDIVETPRVESAPEVAEEQVPEEQRPDNSIAVLPFANVSADPDNEFFCDGISEEILHKLAVFDDLHVIGRQSSFAFKGSDYRIPKIAGLLGVQYLLQGSVRKYEDQLRITAQLVNDAGEQIWSHAFDRRLEDIFAIQTEIADVVATTVVPRIVPAHAPAYEPDLSAYQHYLAGRELVHARQVTEARRELARAIEIDPDFAEAQAEYAVAKLIFESDAAEVAEARQAIDRAFELQPGLVRAKAAEGLYLIGMQPPEYEAAEAILRDVLAEDPVMSDAYNWLGNALYQLGRPDDAMAVQEQGIRTDPMHPTLSANLAFGYLERGKPERAEAIFLRLAELPEPNLIILLDLAELYAMTGRLVEGNAWAYRTALDSSLGTNWKAGRYLRLAESYARLGDATRAAFWNDRAGQPVPEEGTFQWLWWMSTTYSPAVWAGRYDEGMESFDAVIAALDTDLKALNPFILCQRLILHSLAGDHAGAVRTAELLPGGIDGQSNSQCGSFYGGLLALAWSHGQAGAADRAGDLLSAFEQRVSEMDEQGLLHRSEYLFEFALGALLSGEREAALDRLQRAIDAGWRDYYLVHHDPRLQSLSDDPRYRQMMMEVKADVDRQREEVTSIDSEDELPALMERIRGMRR